MNAQHKYYYSAKGKKTSLKSTWKKRGLNMDNFDNIYDRYINTECCDKCKCSFENTTKCMEHNHITGEFRGVVCRSCNNNMLDNSSKNKIKNISFYKREKIWVYKKSFYGKTYQKRFKNKTDAICYKYIMLLKFSILKKNKFNNIK